MSEKLLKNDAKSGNWLDGYRFSSNPLDKDIKSFIDNININWGFNEFIETFNYL